MSELGVESGLTALRWEGDYLLPKLYPSKQPFIRVLTVKPLAREVTCERERSGAWTFGRKKSQLSHAFVQRGPMSLADPPKHEAWVLGRLEPTVPSRKHFCVGASVGKVCKRFDISPH